MPRRRPRAETSDDRAARLFRESALAYSDGRFDEAIDKLLEARGLKAEPLLDYNLGRAYEAAGRYGDAADAYARYIAAAPNIPDRNVLDARIARLRKQEEQAEEIRRPAAPAPAPARVEPPPPPPARTETPERGPLVYAPWAIAGASVVAGGLGLAFGLSSRSQYDDAVAEPSQSGAAARLDDARGSATAANISFVAAGVLLTTAAVWLVLRTTSRPDRSH